MAVIMGIDHSLYEAAEMDGANRIKKIFYITLPMLKTTIVLLLLLSVGSIFYGDFGMIYTMVGDNALLFPTTDVIDTYVYRSLRSSQNLGMSAAVGFYQSVIGFVLILITNTITKKIDRESAIF
jgi:putative aldouronate transport system permease protein